MSYCAVFQARTSFSRVIPFFTHEPAAADVNAGQIPNGVGFPVS